MNVLLNKFAYNCRSWPGNHFKRSFEIYWRRFAKLEQFESSIPQPSASVYKSGRGQKNPWWVASIPDVLADHVKKQKFRDTDISLSINEL